MLRKRHRIESCMPRMRLHARLGSLRQKLRSVPEPRHGWLREIRRAIGFTLEEAATHLGVVPSTLHRFEVAEEKGTIQLGTLRRAADALGFDVVYVLLPRDPRALSNEVQRELRAAELYRELEPAFRAYRESRARRQNGAGPPWPGVVP
jgi:transcriptional regulator with XRE-family HTH domain